MFGATPKVVIKEYPLPTSAGSFTLKMYSQRQIVGIINRDGANILLSQERNGSQDSDCSFDLVPSDTTVELASGFLSSVEYLGTIVTEGKLLHLFGAKTVRSEGGAV